MVLKENYNSASQKYGKEMTDELLKLGLPPNFLLSACRFKSENNVNSIKIVELFRKWMTYVLKYEKIDVNKESFDSFFEKIEQGEIQHIVPKILWYNSECSIGSIDSLKVARSIPVENVWCIKARDKFQRFTSLGHKMFIIYSPYKKEPFTYIIAQVHDGEVDYWDMRNYKYSDCFHNVEHNNLENTLPREIVRILYDEAANQTENKEDLNCNKILKTNKKVVRLTESKLRNIITEAVKTVLKEVENPKGVEEIPTWALNYLINGTTDNLSRAEIEEIDNWRRKARIYDVAAPEGEPYFCRYPAFGEPTDVYDCVCLYNN